MGKKKSKKEDHESSFMTVDQCYQEASSLINKLSVDTYSESNDSESSDSESSTSSISNYGYSINDLNKNMKKEKENVKGEIVSVRSTDTDIMIRDDDKIIIIQSRSPVKIFLPEYPVSETTSDNFEGRYLIIKNKNNNIDVYVVTVSNTINDSLKSYTLTGKE